jgi:hypothetical protein
MMWRNAVAADVEALRAQLARCVRTVAGVAAYGFGAATGDRRARLVGLRGAATAALRLGCLHRAAALARELLALAESFREDWYYGNAVHHGHCLLGFVALRRHDRATAVAELLRAGATPGSPQLNAFGPNMELALALLRAGERDAVVRYLMLCARFWRGGAPHGAAGRLRQWIAQVRAGAVPDFGLNLVY